MPGVVDVSAASIRNEPDMPRWQIRTGAALEMHGQVFGAPAERGDAPAGQASRRSVRETESADPAAASRPRRSARPPSTGCRPRRTVSTSGSSGMSGDGWVEGSAVRAGRKPEMLGDRLADVGKAAPAGRLSPALRPGPVPRMGTRSRVWSEPRHDGSQPWSAVSSSRSPVPQHGQRFRAAGGRTPRAPRHSPAMSRRWP